MAKDLSITILMDFYGAMLTDKRYDALDMYYNQDMSLGEIAEELEISRQGVRDSVKHGEKQLMDYEEKLNLAERFMKIRDKISRINNILDQTEHFDSMDEIKSILNEIENSIWYNWFIERRRHYGIWKLGR